MSHGKIHKVDLGNFSRNEIAFIGTTCHKIEDTFDEISRLLTNNKLFFIDGNHQETDREIASKLVVGDTGVHLNSNRIWSRFDYAFEANSFDLTIVNGNHFPAKNQIVFCDETKRGSLERRAPELTCVKAIVNLDGTNNVPDYIKDLVPNSTEIPVLKNIEDLAFWIKNTLLIPPALEALILTGGRSVRMGEDKSQIEYHGIPQWQYLVKCFKDLGMPVNISCREDQQENYKKSEVNLIFDRVNELGPIGGIMSAFMLDSSKAYLTIASDLPNVNSTFLSELISKRDCAANATAFANNEKGWPEPLITIWEPRSFSRIMQFIGVGNTCPRKVLMNSQIHLIEPSDNRYLLNVNHPEERDRVHLSK